VKATNNQQAATTNGQNNIIDIDIFGATTTPNQGQQSAPFTFENTTRVAQSQPVQQTFVPPAPVSVQTPVIAPTIPPQTVQQQPFNAFGQPQQSYVPQPQAFGQQQGYGAPQYPNQFANQQFGGYGQSVQQQSFGYPQNPQPFMGVPNQGYPQQTAYNAYTNPVYATNPQIPVSQPQKNGNLNMGITLTPKK
jgi:hypothetical protein